MPMDGVFINALTGEMNRMLTGARIDRVMQPERDELHLMMRAHGENVRLLLSASANNPRLHITRHAKPNPISAPLFCMLLRKHLAGGRVVEVVQDGLERVVELRVENSDELGERTVRRLIIEIMGRHSNILLVNAQGIILDSIKRVDEGRSRVREVLPGLKYSPPPAQDKLDPLALDREGWQRLALEAEGGDIKSWLVGAIAGIGPSTAVEIVYRAFGESGARFDTLDDDKRMAFADACAAFFGDVRSQRVEPTLLFDEDAEALDFFQFPFLGFPKRLQQPRASLSEALDEYFLARDQRERIGQKRSAIGQTLRTQIARCSRKLAAQQQELMAAEDGGRYRVFGDILTANLHRIPRGAKAVALENYYDPDMASVDIPLQAELGPSENAQRYYKRYAKAKAARSHTAGQIALTQDELTYLLGAQDDLIKCENEEDLADLRDELTQQGYMRPQAGAPGAKRARPESEPQRFLSSDGIEILVGKNNRQNDRLTFKQSLPHELWLHAKDIPGSHVIARAPADSVPDTTLQEAAQLAAYFSTARQSGSVPVDYTTRRHVKKPSGARPGFVIYTHQRTVFVKPEESLVRRLRAAREAEGRS